MENEPDKDSIITPSEPSFARGFVSGLVLVEILMDGGMNQDSFMLVKAVIEQHKQTIPKELWCEIKGEISLHMLSQIFTEVKQAECKAALQGKDTSRESGGLQEAQEGNQAVD